MIEKGPELLVYFGDDADKHASLLQYGINCGRKKFVVRPLVSGNGLIKEVYRNTPN
jgi:hypothetical protein